MTVKLHRSGQGWQIAGTWLTVRRDARGRWRAVGENERTIRWAEEHNLDSMLFSTRREAVRTATALFAVSPPPPRTMTVKLVRVRAGVHHAAGGDERVLRVKSGWRVQVPYAPWCSVTCADLRAARTVIERARHLRRATQRMTDTLRT